MTNIRPVLIVLISSILLASCGGGGGGGTNPPPATTHSVGASFIKGPVSGASCELFQVTSAGAKGSSLATGTTTNGSVSFGSNISYEGTALIECSGGTYTDEATGASLTAPLMRAVVTISGDSTFIVSPLTEIAVQLAEAASDLGTAASTFNTAIAAVLGLSGNITTLVPTDLNTSPAADDAAGQYGTILALISQLHTNTGGSLSDVLTGLVADLADGELSSATLIDLTNASDDLAGSAVASNLSSDALTSVTTSAEIPANQPPTIVLSNTSITLPFGSAVPSLTGFATLSDIEDAAKSLSPSLGVTVTPGTLDTLKPGSYEATYTATDSRGLTDVEVLQITVEAPQIRLVGGSTVSLSPVVSFSDEGAEIFNTDMDVIDEVSGSVPAGLSGSLPHSEGAYQVDYSYGYTNADGTGAELSISRSVTVENQSPTITLDSDMVTVPFGANLANYDLDDLAGYAAVADDEDDFLEIAVTLEILVEVDSVDVGEMALRSIHPGTYVVTYTATDSNDQVTEEVLTIEVGEPQIALNGLAEVTTKPDVAFNDDGAFVTNSDDVMVDTLFATLPSGLDLLDYTIGEYELTYTFDFDLADGSSDSIEVTRSVVVTPLLIDFKVLTRVNGVSPETVYFSAQDTRPVTDSECVNFGGETGDISEDVLISCSSGQYFGYHFDFGDPNSGNFEFADNPVASETPHSKNSQVSAAPRAIHTYVCHDDAGSGHAVANPDVWDAVTDSCKFEAGVRVQNPGGDFADAYIDVYIEPQDLAYDVTNTICVAADGDFSECPVGVPNENKLLDSPNVGEYSGMRVLYKRRTSDTSTPVYSEACINYAESHVRIDAFGSGAYDPIVTRVTAGVDSSCGDRPPDTTAEALSYPQLTKDADGYVTQGWAFDIGVTNLHPGSIRVGLAATMVTWHDLDLDWSADDQFGRDGAYVEMANAANICEGDPDLDCYAVQYPYGIFLSEVRSIGNLSDPPPVNVGCFNACGVINSGIVGSEFKTADEHNARFMGAWGLVVSNSWLRGNHINEGGVGGGGGKSRLTLRQLEIGTSGTLSSKTANPEDFEFGNDAGDGPGYQRADTDETKYSPHYNFVINNWFNDTVMQEPEHNSAAMLEFLSGHRFSGAFGNKFYANPLAESYNPQQISLSGNYMVALDTEYNGANTDCRAGVQGSHESDTYYYDLTTIWDNDINGDPSGGSCPDDIPSPLPPKPDAPGT